MRHVVETTSHASVAASLTLCLLSCQWRPLEVHITKPTRTDTFYTWFESTGTVAERREATINAPTSGKAQVMRGTGSIANAGATIGWVQKTDGSGESTLLSPWRGEIVDAVPSEAMVAAGAVVARLQGGPLVTFELSANDAAAVQALPFCHAETVPEPDRGFRVKRTFDCNILSSSEGPEKRRKLLVELPGPFEIPDGQTEGLVWIMAGRAPSIRTGTRIRLASARFNNVLTVPQSALVRDAQGQDTVFVLNGPSSVAEQRPVHVLAQEPPLAAINEGLVAGDTVMVDPPKDIRAGTQVAVLR